MKQKIVARLFFLACSKLLLNIPMPMTAFETWKIHPSPLSKCINFARHETGEELHPDYRMNPYYLRLDLDGDSSMEYITILVDASGKVRHGLLVCPEEGKGTFYQGVENRMVTELLAPSDSSPPRIVADLMLTQKRSSKTLPPEPYTLVECCEVDGEMTVAFDESSKTVEKSSQTIPMGLDWYPLPKGELLESLDYDGVPIESVELAGEGVGSVWEVTYTVGFMDGNRFRWLIVTIADP